MAIDIPVFSSAELTAIAQRLGDAVIGRDISDYFQDKHFVDDSHESTKWKRLRYYLSKSQNGYGTQVLVTIKEIISPSRFPGNSEAYDVHREAINQILFLRGIELSVDGNFRQVQPACSISEASKRASVIREKLKGRIIHPEVIRFCKAELMQDNYFHAVFEATKGVAERLRQMSGIEADGAKLVDATLLPKQHPLIAINSSQTESEWSEQNGFASIVKGCFEAIRNPCAHTPKIMWTGEEDVVDLLSLLSLIHRKLDSAALTRPKFQN